MNKPSVTVTFNADTRADLERLIADFMGHIGGDAEETSRVYDAEQARAAATIVPTDIGDPPKEEEEPPKQTKKRGRPRKQEKAEDTEAEEAPEQTPKEMMEEALDMLRTLSARPNGMPYVKQVSSHFGVKKLFELPDAKCPELLEMARKVVREYEENEESEAA